MPAAIQPYIIQTYTGNQNSQLSRGGEKPANREGSAISASQNNDSITLSAEGQKLSRNSSTTPVTEKNEKQISSEEKGFAQQALTEEQLRQISELKRRDTEVKTHEQAHLAAAGQYAAGGASFSYTAGPDGKRYATGGEVPIDIGKESSPEATILKMRTVKRAALAPANPSSADRSIAAQATAKESQAMKEILNNTGEKTSQKPLVPTDEDDNSDRTGNSENASSGTQQKKSPVSSIAELTRRTMNTAYQNMAEMAA